MGNTFRPKKEEVIQREKPQEPSQPRREKPLSAPRKPVSAKGIRKKIRLVRRGFNYIFGGGMLKKMELRKNWRIHCLWVLMILFLAYIHLKIESKRELINKLTQDIVIAKDEVMDAVEEGYNLDKQREMEVLTEGAEKGFSNSGYLPYVLKLKEKTK